MGKWAQPDYDQELVRKFRLIFDELKTKLGNDQVWRLAKLLRGILFATLDFTSSWLTWVSSLTLQNGEPYTFDKFVENLDETDHFTKRICEFLVKVCCVLSSVLGCKKPLKLTCALVAIRHSCCRRRGRGGAMLHGRPLTGFEGCELSTMHKRRRNGGIMGLG